MVPKWVVVHTSTTYLRGSLFSSFLVLFNQTFIDYIVVITSFITVCWRIIVSTNVLITQYRHYFSFFTSHAPLRQDWFDELQQYLCVMWWASVGWLVLNLPMIFAIKQAFSQISQIQDVPGIFLWKISCFWLMKNLYICLNVNFCPLCSPSKSWKGLSDSIRDIAFEGMFFTVNHTNICIIFTVVGVWNIRSLEEFMKIGKLFFI